MNEPTSQPPAPPSSRGPLGVPKTWPRNLALFAATVASMQFANPGGWTFTIPLMVILLTHEFGHYVAARIHGVKASLPYFIPLPLSLIGTMGAVISMPERIRSRNALLDIGAAGPIAGLVIAIPVTLYGLSLSPVEPMTGGGLLEGNCLLYLGLKRLAVGPIPEGHDVFLHPIAFAGWVGLLVTSLNLIPVGQLDGGHITYALFGHRADKVAKVVHHALPLLFAYNVVTYQSGAPGAVWLVWFVLLFVFRRLSGGVNHPPFDSGPLSPFRRVTAVICLVLFVLLLMPTPMREGGPMSLQRKITPQVQDVVRRAVSRQPSPTPP